jgi:hypothetical protein
MLQPRVTFWVISLFVAGVACLGYAYSTSTFDAANFGRVIWFTVIGLSGLLAVLTIPRFKSNGGLLIAIWVPTVLLRMLMLPTAPSDDVNRYLWEGRLLTEGISPYAQTANAEALIEYRDQYWAQMNHRDKLTAYPPLTEFGFAAVTMVRYDPMAFKIVFLLADLLVVAGVLKLLKQRGMFLGYVGFYAWNPLVLVAFAGEGHFDVLMLAALVWGLWAWEIGRRKMGATLLAVATGIKWITLPLLPFLLMDKDRWKILFCMISVLLVPAIYFWETLHFLIEGLLAYGGSVSFNGPVYDILFFGLDLDRRICSGVVLVLFFCLVFWRWWFRRSEPMDTHVLWVVGGLVVLSPTVHFWYIVWVLPFVCLRPSPGWISFSVSAGIYFMVWVRVGGDAGWSLSGPQRVLFWAPFFICLVYELWSTRGRIVCPAKRSGKNGFSVSVIIPVYNPSSELLRALSSIESQTLAVSEVILVDASDLETTRQLIAGRSMDVNLIASEKGRGQQIAAGIEAATSEWVVVLHADACFADGSMESLRAAATASSNLVGGAFGQRFTENSWALLPIEILNDLRALFTRTAFGDQIQFFHRTTAVSEQFMPAQPLMEDVESSWRVREFGEFRFLGVYGEVSASKWLRQGWRRRVRLVMSLVSRYRWARLKGRAQAERLSAKLYSEYYSGK